MILELYPTDVKRPGLVLSVESDSDRAVLQELRELWTGTAYLTVRVDQRRSMAVLELIVGHNPEDMQSIAEMGRPAAVIKVGG